MKILTLTPRKPIIYYPSGIITLVLLPVFCLVYMSKHDLFTPANKMEITFWSPDLPKTLFKGTKQSILSKRKYFQINLDGKNDADDQIRLDFARLQIREMLKAKSFTDGVDFHFGVKAKYWTFVKALDICQVENVPSFLPYKDDLYAIYTKPEPIVETFICGNQFRSGDYHIGKSTYQELTFQFLTEQLKLFWAPALLFLIMTFFAFRKLYLNLYR